MFRIPPLQSEGRRVRWVIVRTGFQSETKLGVVREGRFSCIIWMRARNFSVTPRYRSVARCFHKWQPCSITGTRLPVARGRVAPAWGKHLLYSCSSGAVTFSPRQVDRQHARSPVVCFGRALLIVAGRVQAGLCSSVRLFSVGRSRLFLCLSVCLSVHPSVCLLAGMSVGIPVCLSVCLPVYAHVSARVRVTRFVCMLVRHIGMHLTVPTMMTPVPGT